MRHTHYPIYFCHGNVKKTINYCIFALHNVFLRYKTKVYVKLLSKMKELTKVEEEVMQIIWRVKRGIVRDFIDKMDDPKPPYSTISSVVRILEKKGFLAHKAYGKTHEYFPIITKNAYRKYVIQNMLQKYFSGSATNMLSFFAKENDLSLKDVGEMMKKMEEEEE